MESAVNYSIIIPHKNIPNLLARCLSSIPQRQDLEIIVVDNNSDPNIVDFDLFPGKERNDVTIIFDKESKGGGHARNVGLKNAKGKNVLFADADDFFNYCINDILDKYSSEIFDVVYFRANSVDTEFYTISHRARLLNSLIDLYDSNENYALFHLKYSFGEPWCKLVKRSFIEEHYISFDETPIHNDTKFSYLVGYYAKNIKIDKHAIYCVTTREGSVSKLIDEKRRLARIQVFVERERFLINHHINPVDVKLQFHYDEMCRCLDNKDLFEKGLRIFEENGFDRNNVIAHVKRYNKYKKKSTWIGNLKGKLYAFFKGIF